MLRCCWERLGCLGPRVGARLTRTIPGLRFAQEVFGTVRAGLPWVTANGANGIPGANGHPGTNGKQPEERSKTASA